MPDKKKLPEKKEAVTPAKLALIGGLSLVLLYVLLNPGEETEPIVPEENASQTQAAVKQPPKTGAALKHKPGKSILWPKFDLERTVAHNPFVLHDSVESNPQNTQAVEDRATRLQRLLSELQNENVSLILQGPGKSAAMIGNRTVHKGEMIGSFRVVEIHPDGVIVELAE